MNIDTQWEQQALLPPKVTYTIYLSVRPHMLLLHLFYLANVLLVCYCPLLKQRVAHMPTEQQQLHSNNCLLFISFNTDILKNQQILI